MGGSLTVPKITGETSGSPRHQNGTVAPTLNLVNGAPILTPVSETTVISTESYKIAIEVKNTTCACEFFEIC